MLHPAQRGNVGAVSYHFGLKLILPLFLTLGLIMPFQELSAKNLFLDTSLGASSNRYKFTSIDNESSLDSSFNLRYLGPYQINFGHYLEASRSFQGEQKWEFSDGFFSASKNVGMINDKISTTLLTRIYYPLSEKSKDLDGMITKIMLAPQFSSNLELLSAPFITVRYRPSYTHSFYEYKVSLDGSSNLRSSFGQLFVLEINGWELFILSSSFSYTLSWSQYGNQRPDSFAWEESLEIPLGQNLSTNFSYTNLARAKDSNGIDNNVKPFDDRTGVFSANLTFTL